MYTTQSPKARRFRKVC